MNYVRFQAENITCYSRSKYNWPKAFQVLLSKQRITAHSVTVLVAFYACAIIVHAHFRDFSIRAERPVVTMLRETLIQ